MNPDPGFYIESGVPPLVNGEVEVRYPGSGSYRRSHEIAVAAVNQDDSGTNFTSSSLDKLHPDQDDFTLQELHQSVVRKQRLPDRTRLQKTFCPPIAMRHLDSQSHPTAE